MRYQQVGQSEVRLSVIGLGGHEFLPDGRVRAMGEEFHRAVTPGVIWEGFGGENRRRIVKLALQAGVNFFDLTMDSEKEALARNLAELPQPHPIYIQTRPEGMVYNNDPSDLTKRRLLDYDLLKAEAERACSLLHRPQIDCCNFGLHPPAVNQQPDYIPTLARNVTRLKRDRLIRFASVDTLAGEAISLALIETGAFDAVFTSFSIVNDAPLERLIPAAMKRGLAVFAREAFVKGHLFTLGEAAGIRDRAALARASIRWILSRGVVASLVLGVASADQLAQNLAAADQPTLTDEDTALLKALQATPDFASSHSRQTEQFRTGWF